MIPVHRNMFPSFLQALGKKGTIVEVGVAEGNFSHVMLTEWPYGYVMVDAWRHLQGYDDPMNGHDSEHETRYEMAKQVAARFGDRVRIIRDDSVASASFFDDKSIDMVYIDGDHSYDGCTRDILAWFPKISSGGILAGHDYHNITPVGVRKAVADVCGGPCGITHERTPSWWLRVR